MESYLQLNANNIVTKELRDISANFRHTTNNEKRKLDIRGISLNVYQGCNLRCNYCFAGEGDYGQKSMMTFAVAKAAITQLSAGKKTFIIKFFGGEPLLNFPLIKQVVTWCKKQNCNYIFHMTSNATLINDNIMNWIKENKIRLTISYDGKTLHAKQRLNKDLKSNSEKLVTQKLTKFENSFKELKRFMLRSTVSKENVKYLKDDILKNLNSKSYRISVARTTSSKSEEVFGHDDIAKLGKVFVAVVEYYLKTQDYSTLLKFENIKYYLNIIHKGVLDRPACDAGINYVTLSSKGNYYLCHRFNESEDELFGDVINNIDKKKVQEVLDFRQSNNDPCKSCWMKNWCKGGCMHNNKSQTGNLFKVDPKFCQLQDIEATLAVKVYTHILRTSPKSLELLL